LTPASAFSSQNMEDHTMKTDKQKAQEILKKRRLAAKGLEERKDGKPIDPMEDVGTLAIDSDADEPETTEQKERDVANRGFAIGLGFRH
jgi:hypothetical protein